MNNACRAFLLQRRDSKRKRARSLFQIILALFASRSNSIAVAITNADAVLTRFVTTISVGCEGAGVLFSTLHTDVRDRDGF
ncbi:exported protein of unknown function [Pseudorhizobium banfieldiae]|uniref:Uncharacterized protein n=1 Tax=Pseudorhizobium banfieldiae TaxID=1125847 RepID=L0ND33_9HYPH|nr:exported protein of unknown function [Pseudorhizobium banfieldiae]